MFDSSGLFDRGWTVVKAFTDPNGLKGCHARQNGDRSLFKLMEKLRDKVMRRKDNALYATMPLELVEQLTHEPGSTPPMDWVCWFPCWSLDRSITYPPSGIGKMDNG